MRIITISREFGSGGREIGKRLAEALNIAYYDSEIISKIAQEMNLDENYLNNIIEKGIHNFNFHFGNSFNFSYNQTAINVLVTQQKIIKELAQKGDAVFVGRGADVILKDYNPFKIFVYADMDYKIKRCKERDTKDNSLSDKELIKKIKQIDSNRSKVHDLLSNTKWNDCKAYNLCLNTTKMKIETIIPVLANYVERWFNH